MLQVPSQMMGASQEVRTRTLFLLEHKRAARQCASWEEVEHTKGPGAHHPPPGLRPPPPHAFRDPPGAPSFQKDFTLARNPNADLCKSLPALSKPGPCWTSEWELGFPSKARGPSPGREGASPPHTFFGGQGTESRKCKAQREKRTENNLWARNPDLRNRERKRIWQSCTR